jgi:MFS family permease
LSSGCIKIITKTLHGSAIQGFWSGTGFLLASTACQPLFASFSHIFGRRQLLLVALIPFTIGSLVAGCARNFTILLIGRCFQGVGGGGIIALTSVLLTDLVPLRERGKWSGLINAMWAIGSVVGTPIGGALAQKASWVSWNQHGEDRSVH